MELVSGVEILIASLGERSLVTLLNSEYRDSEETRSRVSGASSASVTETTENVVKVHK